MGMEQITPELVKEFWKDALVKFDAKSVDKDDSTFMKSIGTFLDAIKVLDKEDFMERFTTTIFKTIYRPFKIGDTANYSLWGQITVLVHELVHVLQFEDDEVGFTVGYIANESSRAAYEADAYSADMEMHWWMYGEIYDIKRRASALKHYGLEQDEIDFAASVIESNSLTVQNSDAAVNEVAAWAMTWLEEHGVTPEHKAA